MKKSDLKPGMVVEKRDGGRYLVTSNFCGDEIRWTNLDGKSTISSYDYDENLETVRYFWFRPDDWKIMKVYEDYTCTKVLWERKERPVLTEAEKVILRNIDPMYTYIARDSGGDSLVWAYPTKPKKNSCGWSDGSGMYEHLQLFNHLFKFIKFEDEEPYSIKCLLGESETNE